MLARNADLNNNDIFPYPLSNLVTTVFSSKWRLRNEWRNSILMTRPYPDLGGASDWLNQISHTARPIRKDLKFPMLKINTYKNAASRFNPTQLNTYKYL